MASSNQTRLSFLNRIPKWFLGLIGLFIAVVDAFFSLTLLSAFWTFDRTIRFLLSLGSIVFFIVLLRMLIAPILPGNQSKRTDKEYQITFFSIFLYFILMILLLTIDIPDTFNESWLHGLGLTLIRINKILFILGNFLLLLFFVLLTRTRRKWKNNNNPYVFFAVIFFSINLIWGRGLVQEGLSRKNVDYLEDFRYLYQTLRRKAGDRIYKDTILVNGDWIVYTGDYSIPDYQHSDLYTEEELQKVYRTLDYLEEYLSSKGKTLLVVFPPNKNTIYPEYVPDEIPVLNDISRLDQVIDYQKEHDGVDILNLRPALLKGKQERRNYFTDDSHWNFYGSYAGYQEIIRALQETYPDLIEYSIDDFDKVDDVRIGDLSTISGLNLSEEYEDFSPKEDLASNFKLIQDIPNTIYKNIDSELPQLLVYHDSFGGMFYPFFPLNFSRTTFISRFDQELTLETIEEVDPDIVIIEFTERLINLVISNLPAKP